MGPFYHGIHKNALEMWDSYEYIWITGFKNSSCSFLKKKDYVFEYLLCVIQCAWTFPELVNYFITS